MRRLALVALVGAVFGCSSSPETPPSPGSTPGHDAGSADARAGADAAAESGTRDAAGDGTEGGDGGREGASPEAAAGMDAGEAGDGGDAPDADEGGGFPPPAAALCSPSASWQTGVLLPVSTPDDDELDSVTPDELSIAWIVGTGSAAMIEYADRATAGDAFGAPQVLPAGLFVTDRVSLSQDGLRLAFVDPDRQGFSELTRASRAAPGNTFGGPAVGEFSNLDGPGALGAGQFYGDPVLSADDTAFYYSVYGGGQTATLFRTARLVPGDTWPVGVALPASSGLAAQGSLRRRPTGISADDQTLFFWDEVLGTERAAWMDESTGAFDAFVDLGTRTMAAPDATCARLYYSAAGTGSVDLFVAGD
jgi:hypothetical protein